MDTMKIAVLMTVHNRKDVTLRSLQTLYNTIDFLREELIFDIYMTDDGCTDGTSEAVANLFPQVTILKGDGNLFWGRGMNTAWKAAASIYDYDAYIWMNDDAYLYDNALAELIKGWRELGDNTIISGAFVDVEGNPSYGGMNKHLIPYKANGNYQKIDYMNGNFVLVPKCIFKKVGYIDGFYHHGGGDFAYGCKAIRDGFNVVLSSCNVGTTNRNMPAPPKFSLPQYSLKVRLSYLYSPITNPWIDFILNWKYRSRRVAIKNFVWAHAIMLFPGLYSSIKHLKKN